MTEETSQKLTEKEVAELFMADLKSVLSKWSAALEIGSDSVFISREDKIVVYIPLDDINNKHGGALFSLGGYIDKNSTINKIKIL